ncbi:MAG: YfiR family protein [Methylomonas sp.]|nr:YfiR family protein [Methylomonas sp.]
MMTPDRYGSNLANNIAKLALILDVVTRLLGVFGCRGYGGLECRPGISHPRLFVGSCIGRAYARGGLLSRVIDICKILCLLGLLISPSLGATQGLVTQNPYKVKAAFLRNFAHYVTWPNNALSDSDSFWCIGILGPDPFGDALETTLQGRTELGRPFNIFRVYKTEELPPCHIVFIAYQDAGKRRAILAELKNKPILTVGESPEFLEEGGVIKFEVQDRVRMSINLDQARAASLKIQTKMLEVSSDILENGAIRHVR